MTLASNRYYKVDSGYEKEVSFFDVETWTRLAEQCYDKGRKGRGIRVVGRLRQDRWTDTDGKPHSKIKIVAEHVEFRPEFKKDEDVKSATDASAADLVSPYMDYSDSEAENVESILATAKELEPVF
jgi:single-strand DNA-binding protein